MSNTSARGKMFKNHLKVPRMSPKTPPKLQKMMECHSS